MKVLQLGPFPPPHGGVETNLMALRDYLRRCGDSCAVINITHHRKADADEVYYPRNVWELLRLLIQLRCDVLHLHMGGHLSLRLLGLILVCTLLPGCIKVVTFHSGGYPSSAGGRSARWWTLRGFIFRRVDGIITVNQELVILFYRLGVPKGRIRLIAPHAIPEVKGDAPLPAEFEQFCARHAPLLLSVGQLEPEYDLPLQIAALGNLRARFPKAGLMLIGSGSLKDAIAGLIRAQSYAEHILLCGDVPHETTLRAMTQADVLLRTTHYDGDSISVREALHQGLPVVASDNGMRPAGVHLVPVGDVDVVVSAVSSLVEAGVTGQRGRGTGASGEENLEAVRRFYEELGVEE